jgi:AcrR family transcriptional regulator
VVPRGDDRARIRRALIDLCYERGYAELELEDVLVRAEVDERGFQRHFGDLEDCFYEVYKGEIERFFQQAEDARAGLTDWGERVRVTAYTLYRYLATDERIRWLTVVEVRTAGERSLLLAGKGTETLIDLIDEGQSSRGERGAPTRATAEAAGGGVFNLLFTASATRGRFPSEEQIVPSLMYAVILPYCGEEAARRELTIPPPPRLMDDRARIRRALIDLCYERGYAEVTDQEVLDRAGVGVGSFHRHFTDLEDCFCQLYEAERNRILGAFTSAVAGLQEWRERMRAVAYTLYRHLERDQRLTHFVVLDVRVAGERAQRLQWEGIAEAAELLDEGRDELEDPDRISRATAESIAGGLFNLLFTAASEGPLPPADAVVPEGIYLAVLPYLGEEAARAELDAPAP